MRWLPPEGALSGFGRPGVEVKPPRSHALAAPEGALSGFGRPGATKIATMNPTAPRGALLRSFPATILRPCRRSAMSTDSNTNYMEVREIVLPSDLSTFSTLQKIDFTQPFRIGPFEPHRAYDGDIADTAALEAWVTQVRARAAHPGRQVLAMPRAPIRNHMRMCKGRPGSLSAWADGLVWQYAWPIPTVGPTVPGRTQ